VGRLRFGIRFNSASGTIAQVVRWAQIAEDAGFDDLWYCQDLMLRDAWVVLAAIAGATRRLRVGTAIVNPFSSSPAELAMRAASLQELSGGRFVLGIGPGDPPHLGWIGLRQTHPLTGLREAVGLIRALLRGEEAAFDGQVFRGWTRNARLKFPLPVHPVPVYIGGQGPKVTEFMGEAGDGGLPIVFPPEVIDGVVARVRAGAARAGRTLDGFDLAACVWWSLGPSRQAAQDALRPLIAYYGPSLRAEVLAPIGLAPADFEAIRGAWAAGDRAKAEALVEPRMFRLAIAGERDEVVARVRWLASRGATQVNIGPPLGPDRERALRETARVIAAVR
jgi:5,10-methylenetetrahydromethanopterin reductase